MTARSVLIALLFAACAPAAVPLARRSPPGLSASLPLPSKPAPPLQPAPDTDRQLAAVASEATAEFPALKEDAVSIVVIDRMRQRASAYRGDASYYPASVVKLAYLAFYEASKMAGRIQESAELRRAVKDMITLSSNDATGLVVDAITDTTSGLELTGAEWETWKAKRNVVTAWYRARGYTNLNANQKPFCDDGYGREHAYRDGEANRNRMTSLEAARLLDEIVRGDVAGPLLTEEMMALLSRQAGETALPDAEPEIARRVGQSLPPGTRLWSKSGDAYDLRHLVGRVLLPSGQDWIVAVFTQGVRSDLRILPWIYGKLAEKVSFHD